MLEILATITTLFVYMIDWSALLGFIAGLFNGGVK